ncbi:hypothetical protein G1H11_01080 [Phytoactinopolyspora alkaliphila]|uniref:Sensor domain-containing protein n=1 Tax=Phytoactinopolyspora alkaliphila TaxID=1783498 RepID=A0A6N9YG66_9ACTN|nr:hypothetical protein [Phytoactinopolyspora alkaliphila]NED93905.1 hypothetical protein [Phytoactinopolyspora alkaliphila]
MRSRAASRRRAGWVVVVLGALTVVSACTADEPDASTAASREAASTSGGTATQRPGESGEASAGPDAPASRKVQAILDSVRFGEHEIGLAVSDTYKRESGLDTPTAAYCGDDADPVDQYRVARSQRWWLNEEWSARDPGGYTVGVEVVLYAPGTAAAAMAVFEAVPATCPAADFASGSSAAFSRGEIPHGLPPGASALRDDWTYADGTRATGRIIAISAGDVVGYLYIRGNDDAVAGRTDELARTLAEKITEADELIRADPELP